MAAVALWLILGGMLAIYIVLYARSLKKPHMHCDCCEKECKKTE